MKKFEALPEAEPLDEATFQEIVKRFSTEYDQGVEIDEHDNINTEEVDVDDIPNLKTKLIVEQNKLRKCQKEMTEIMEVIDKINAKIKHKECEDTTDKRSNRAKIRIQVKCKFFERGYCKYGSKCRFRHPSRACEDFEMNLCSDGAKCEHRHPKRVCLYWMRGHCSEGEKCLFRHIKSNHGNANKESPPHIKHIKICRYFENGNCRKGENCCFLHPDIECRYSRNNKPCPKGVKCLEFHRAQPHSFRDCEFWLQGYCKDQSKCSQGRHEDSKWGSKRRKTSSQGWTFDISHNNGNDYLEDILAQAVEEVKRTCSPKNNQTSPHDFLYRLEELLRYDSFSRNSRRFY